LIALASGPVEQLVHLGIAVAHPVEPALAVQEDVGIAIGVGPARPANPERGEVVTVEVGQELAEFEQLDLSCRRRLS